MFLSNLWHKYENIIVYYSDVNSEIKHAFALILAIFPFIIFNYIFYHFILGFNNEHLHFLLLGLAFGKGKLFLFYIMKKNKCDFGGGYNNIFLQLLSVSMVCIGIIGMIYLIIKDINGGFKTPPKPKVEVKYNNSLLNNTNKYDYLNIEKKE